MSSLLLSETAAFDRRYLFVFIGYMNLPRSAVTPTIPKNNNSATSPDQHHSDYMNLEPKDTHIYQNTSILNIAPGTPGLVGPDDEVATTNQGLESVVSHADSDTDDRETSESAGSTGSSSEPTSSSASQSNDGSLDEDHSSDSNGANDQQVHSSDTHSSPKPRPTKSEGQTKSADVTLKTASNNTSGNSSKFYSRSANDSLASATALSPRRREAMADSTFVERKYGLIFTDDYPGCQNETKTSDVSRNSQRSRNL